MITYYKRIINITEENRQKIDVFLVHMVEKFLDGLVIRNLKDCDQRQFDKNKDFDFNLIMLLKNNNINAKS